MKKGSASDRIYTCEAEVHEGLEDIAAAELRQLYGQQLRFTSHQFKGGALQFSYQGDLRSLSRSTTVQAIYLVRAFAVPRPRALLGDQHFRALLDQIETVRRLYPPHTFRTLYLNAAGSDSSIMLRLKEAIAQHTQLTINDEQGDLLLRLRRSASSEPGWDALVRLTPRPLATRSWRVCNFEGALNAAVARAMVHLSQPTADNLFVNLGCGSGSLMIERASWGKARAVLGIDIDRGTLRCARENIAASGFAGAITLCEGDIRALPLPDHSIDVLCADLPFGQRTGSHQENLALYPAVLAEAARAALPNGYFVAITHEVRLIEALLSESKDWTTENIHRVVLRGLHPRIYVLRRR